MSATLTPPAAPPPSPLKTIQIGSTWSIPATVVDLDSFRDWVKSDAFPEKMRVAWLDGQLWVDADMEQLYSHNAIKTEFASVLHPLARTTGLGRFVTAGMLLTIPPNSFSTGPDGMLLTFAALDAGRLVEVANSRAVGVVEVVGVPDMVL